VVVFYSDQEPPRDIDEILDAIPDRVPEFPGFHNIEEFDLKQLNYPIFGNSQFRIKDGDTAHNQPPLGVYTFSVGDDRVSVSANIFIHYVDINDGLLLSTLSSTRYGTLLRQFAEGRTPCFFTLISRDDHLLAANVIIRNDLDSELESACIYEEVTQSLGLLNDHEGSEIFTYDNRPIGTSATDADFALLRALYDPAVQPGDQPEKVVRIFLKNIQ
jgi:hypothetical protein